MIDYERKLIFDAIKYSDEIINHSDLNSDSYWIVKDIITLSEKICNKEQLKLINLWRRGYENEEIAEETNLTIKQVKNKKYNISKKISKKYKILN